MKARITRIVEQGDDYSEVEVEVTIVVRTTIREGRDLPDMSCEATGEQMPELLSVRVHEALDGDPILESELRRILD